MILKKIILENIRSYENQIIEFPRGSILLSGDVGSGKTSVLLGVEFALFGLQPGQRGMALLRNGKKTGRVRLEIEVDGKEFVIERALKRGKSISQDYCSIIIDGEKKDMSASELKNFVLELLNYPKEFSKKQNILYKFTVYTPQEEMKQIIMEDSETRVNILRHVFGMDKYKKILENVSRVALKIREEKRIKEGMVANLDHEKTIKSSKEEEFEEKQRDLMNIEKELLDKAEARKRIQDEEREISKKIEEKNKLMQEIEKIGIVVSNKKELLSTNKERIGQIKVQIESLKALKFDESRLHKLENEKPLKNSDREKINGKILEVLSQINSLKIRSDENKKIQSKIASLEICPTCLQDVDAVYRANVLNKLHSDNAENLSKINFLEEERKKISSDLNDLDKIISQVDKEINELKISKIQLSGIGEKQEQIDSLDKSSLMLAQDMELLDQHFHSLKLSVFNLKKFDNLFELKKRELEKALQEERNEEIKVAALKREIEVFSRQIKELEERIKNSEAVKSEMVYLGRVEDWLSNKFSPLISFIEKNVMTKLRREFSTLFAEWFDLLVSDNFDVRIDESFSPIVGHQDYELDYGYLSGGERTAVALAYRLALNQVINSLLSTIKTKDIVILDEPTDGFSSQQLDKMREIFRQLKLAQLIIVSHEQKIEDFVENVIKFRKEDGITKVVVG